MVGEADSTNAAKWREALLTENLKTLRLIHQILMVVATGVLAFALRPDPSDAYKSALDELFALQEVSFDSWGSFIADRYKANASQNDKLAKEVVRQAGLTIEGHPILGQPVRGDLPPSIDTARLIDLDAFLRGSRKIGILELSPERQTAGVEQLRRAIAAGNPQPAVTGISLSMGAETPLVNGVRMLDWRNPPPVPLAALNVYFRGQAVAANAAVACSTVSETGHFAMDWLREDRVGQKLVEWKTGVIFPHVKLFWDRVGTHTVGQATLFFQEELASTARGTVSFFGIPVERKLAVWAGPAVCFSIMFFLCLHVRHFRRSVGENDQIRSFPWVPLFGDAWGLAATYSTVMILPAVANEELLRNYAPGGGWSAVLGIAFAVLMLAAGVWTLIEIQMLRRQQPR